MTVFFVLFFFKQKTAYEMRISDWSSDVCSSDLIGNDDMACADPFADTGSDDADRAGAGDQYVLADHVELQRAMRGVAERIEECGKFGGNFVRNRPQIAARHHHIFGERAGAVDAEAGLGRAQMRADGGGGGGRCADDKAFRPTQERRGG